MKYLQALKLNKPPGPDYIPSRILQVCANEVAPSITVLLIKSFSTGAVPDDWKSADISPIHKKGSNNKSHSFYSLSTIGRSLEITPSQPTRLGKSLRQCSPWAATSKTKQVRYWRKHAWLTTRSGAACGRIGSFHLWQQLSKLHSWRKFSENCTKRQGPRSYYIKRFIMEQA